MWASDTEEPWLQDGVPNLRLLLRGILIAFSSLLHRGPPKMSSASGKVSQISHTVSLVTVTLASRIKKKYLSKER